ncbi:IS1182-like element ISMno15 family transposase [Methylobacterium nodulans]|uniref:Transposase IS4 family protein n=1 Tax=Methylobacterium nodulans (strain LMG 21967 / CNCM I-2342 / ORS 2060) TaxID=460265 RepID=B8IW98_METNO|nr:IS1182-like element ISMno15 family transposase [Methylobacterium nodulans]ACL62688.1 transposase IS4 family protein [Methylobacterium nodulans ORS 2060]ACL62783.1 transposase IS4 family protein [Methylobacterium nodulans ORS 2060]
MTRFIAGEDRQQVTLLPDCLDDYVAADNPVRLAEAFVDELDLAALGCAGAVPEATGRPAYDPATLLKLYLYGYLNRIPSSRRLERESPRNLELIWLTGRLMPDFKTLADFRKNNGPAIQATCAQFVVLCRRLNLFSKAIVAVDGSKFKAVNNRDKNFTVAKLEARVAQVEASVARYLAALDRADREPSDVAEARTARLTEKIAALREQMQDLQAMRQRVEEAPDQQVALTDPDARSLATRGKGTGLVGYNVQAAVDVEHHLIVAHAVTNVGSDRAQLAPMGVLAQEATGCEPITVLADRGYLNGDQVLVCEGTGVLPCVPKTLTSGNVKRGLFTGQDFIYDAQKDHYTCPAGQHLTKAPARSDRRDEIDHYRNRTACPACALKPRCTTEAARRIKRWVHEGVLDAMQARLDGMPDAMKVRRQTVEHPFGTLKAWMGATHFLTRTLAKVRTEMSLQVLAYNMKRMIQIFGVGALITAIRA